MPTYQTCIFMELAATLANDLEAFESWS